MNLKKILEDEKGNQITISVDYNHGTDTVEKVEYVYASKGSIGVDITTIFIEQMNGDAIIDAINWRELYYADDNYEPTENELALEAQ